MSASVQDKGERSLPIQTGLERHEAVYFDRNGGLSSGDGSVIGDAGRLEHLIAHCDVDAVIGNLKNVEVPGTVIRGYFERQEHATHRFIARVGGHLDRGWHGSYGFRQ